MATAHVGARILCYFNILFRGSSLISLWENLCSWKNQKRKKVRDKKDSVPFYQEKKKISWRKRLVLAELHVGVYISNKEVAVKPKFAIYDAKTGFLFLYVSTSIDTKTLTISSNRNFEAVCLASKHIFRFFHFCGGFPFAIKKKKKKTCLQSVTFPGRSRSIVIDARKSCCPIGLRFQEARY